METAMEITFWGATEDVTGSMTFVRMQEGLIAIDSGFTQGSAEALKLNDLQLPYHPGDIKAVILTHAHLDHSGYLPLLVKKGFKGPVYCTKATAHLARIILKDSASLEDQSYYEDEDVTKTLQLIRPLDWHQTQVLCGGSFSLFPAGHILGASSVMLHGNNKTLVFSGDLGRKDDPILPAAESCPIVDAVVMESTYGGKIREGGLEKDLHTFLMKISRESRVGIVASFAVARGQMLITLINDFFSRHPEEKIRVVFDSPMMAKANEVYKSFAELTKIPDSIRVALSSLESIEHEGQWESLRKKKGPLLIISSSGMLTGGRIGRHLLNWSQDSGAVLFLPGYQAHGTPGRSLLEGKRVLKGPGDYSFEWKGEVIGSDAFSSHADQNELLEWTKDLLPGTEIYLIHGEEKSKEELKKKLSLKGMNVKIPFRCESVKLK
jgi:metallo-beta-lactamase family protein